MTTPDTHTGPQAPATTSAWELVNALAELGPLPTPDFARLLIERLANLPGVTGCGLWLWQPPDKISLVIDRDLSTSPLVHDPRLVPRHLGWLADLLRQSTAAAMEWTDPGDGDPTGIRSEGVAIRPEGAPIAILEWTRRIAPEFEDQPELLEELARQLGDRWGRHETAPPPATSPTVPQPPPIIVTTAAAPPPSDEARPMSGPETGAAPTIPIIPPPPPVEPVRPIPRSAAPGREYPPTRPPRNREADPVTVPGDTATMRADLWRLALALQQSHEVRRVADIAAQDGRLWLGCDRLTVMLGPRTRVTAISGATSWSRRSPVIRAAERLGRLVLAGRRPLNFPTDPDQLPPEVAAALADYVAEAQPRGCRIIPIRAAENVAAPDGAPVRSPRWLGCLLAEQFQTELPGQESASRLELLAETLAPTLEHALRLAAIPGFTWAYRLGVFRWWLRGWRLAGAWLILVALVATVAALILIPYPHRVEAEGQMFPAQRRELYAPDDGKVAELLVHSGDVVTAGQLLARLRNEELSAEQVELQARVTETKRGLRALETQIDQARRAGRRDEELRRFGELEESRARLAGLERQSALVDRRLADLEVRAPVAGVVATFQIEQLLDQRPVIRGQRLLSIMQPEGPWRIELTLEEQRLGHLLRARRATAEPLDVEYVLITTPEQRWRATLRDVSTRASLSAEDRLVVPLIAEPTAQLPPVRRIGAEVRARIACGSRPLGYVLFGDVIEFLQRYAWW